MNVDFGPTNPKEMKNESEMICAPGTRNFLTISLIQIDTYWPEIDLNPNIPSLNSFSNKSGSSSVM
jgi:hypothetical protein